MIKKFLKELAITLILINLYFWNPFKFIRLEIIFLTLLLVFSKDWFPIIFFSFILDFYLKEFLLFGSITFYTIIMKLLHKYLINQILNPNSNLSFLAYFNLIYFPYLLIYFLESRIINSFTNFSLKLEIIKYLFSLLIFIILAILMKRYKFIKTKLIRKYERI